MRGVALSGFCCVAICSSGLVSVAFADLYGREINTTQIRMESAYFPEEIIDHGSVIAGEGIEYFWEHVIMDYSDPDNPVVGGYLYRFVDYQPDAIFWGYTFDNEASYWQWLSHAPTDFTGMEFEILEADPSQNTSINTCSVSLVDPNAYHLGDGNYWSKTDPDFESYVDSYWMDPNDSARLGVTNNLTVRHNIQGITHDFNVGETRTIGYIIDITFECEGDVDSDGSVDIHDLLALVAAWGDCPDPCSADINEDQIVNIHDLLALVAAWGECP